MDIEIYKSGAVEIDSPRKWLLLPPATTTFSSLEGAKTQLNRKDKNLNRIGYTLAGVANLGALAVLGGGLDTAFFHQLPNYDSIIMLGGLGVATGSFIPVVPTIAYQMRVREQLNVVNNLENTPSQDTSPINQ